MSETSMARAFKKAGLNTPQDKLELLALDALDKRKQNIERAVKDARKTIEQDPKLILALWKDSGALPGFDKAVEGLMRRMMRSESGGRTAREPQRNPAPVSPNGAGRGHSSLENHGSSAPIAPLKTGERGQTWRDAQTFSASLASNSGREQTKDQRRAMVSAGKSAAKSIFDREISAGIKGRGSTKRDWVTVRRKGVVMGHIADRVLSEVPFPDEDKTTLENLISEKKYQEILSSGYKVLDAMGVTNVPR